MKSDIRTLDLNLLKTLDALLDERNVTRAAQRLSLTQPAVSGMLNRLRDYFDDPLFVRTPHGIVPTLRAREMAAPIKQILSDIDILLKPAQFDPLTETLTFTVAATDYALKAVIVPFIAALRARAPGIRVRVVPVEPEQLTTQFEQGKIDLALLTPDSTPDNLHNRSLYNEEYVCLMRHDHPDAHQALTLDRFCALEHVLVSYKGESFWGVTDDALAEVGRKRQIGLSVSSFLVLPDILAISEMIAVVPARLAYTDPRMHVVSPPLPITGFTKSMAWHERTHRDAAHQWLRNLVHETSQSKP
ncbi:MULTISPECIES: LysR family transcriptional regulator [unclassified Citrobacter]|uniref:LysR family transcriptional regulator n=1 Tax=unclassified Citrobacter TaxID=2644389 RepID=UPI0017B0D3DC|nr:MULTISPECIES: LysR family transcriptional regulator [unclassified Citrobacter]HCJ6375514.1 LysR family transcriptional regulator [Citrobacter freundii]MBA7965211.1 LysR family transcriptional regulator [Citrobacter sp. RHBSTW-00671]MDW2645445.1 LysR family transcriptional regulator [Citrobacter sp. HN-141]MDW2655010.1 LysR family transcriptional regulator [Citrobacter sp. HN-120]MDW2698035.1 LysR family transcriptional regulator [Citrobacter sp. HN-144]